MTSAIIVAAGQGTRMGPDVDKLFLEVAGRPVVAHTWATFNNAACIDEIILVVRDTLQPACAQSCPTDAIIFGDWNDPSSRVNLLAQAQRNYRLLEHLGTQPSVVYLKKVDPNAKEEKIQL